MKRSKNLLFLLAILLAGLYFSFYNLKGLYQFNFDQERDYLAVSLILSGKQTLIGPPAVGTFHLGPWYYYALVPFFLIFQGHPLFGAYLAGLLNLLTAYLIYFFLKKHSHLIGFLTALLWLSSFEHLLWNVSFIPPLVLGCLLIVQQKKPTFLSAATLAFFVGLGINFHFQFVFFLPLLFFWIYQHHLFRRPKMLSTLLLAFFLPFFPLILFDLRHDSINLQSFLNFVSASNDLPTTLLGRIFFGFRNLTREFSFFLPPPNQYSAYKYFVVPLLLLALIFRSFKDRLLFWLSIPLLTSVISLSFYSTPNWPEYYQRSAALLLLIGTALLLSRFRFGNLLLLLLSLAVVIPAALLLPQRTYGEAYQHKEDLIRYILDDALPLQPNITYDFPFGEGYGFGVIRSYHETKGQPYGEQTYFVSYANNKAHQGSLKTFGVFGVSIINP